jgi:hypothetical protein
MSGELCEMGDEWRWASEDTPLSRETRDRYRSEMQLWRYADDAREEDDIMRLPDYDARVGLSELCVNAALDLISMRRTRPGQLCRMSWVFGKPLCAKQFEYFGNVPLDGLAKRVCGLPDELCVEILKHLRGWSVVLAVLCESRAFGHLLEMVACCHWWGVSIQGVVISPPTWTFFPVLLDVNKGCKGHCHGQVYGYSIVDRFTGFTYDECRRRHALRRSVAREENTVIFERCVYFDCDWTYCSRLDCHSAGSKWALWR